MEELVREAGLPEALALQVARDRITLSEAVRRLADLERVERLVRRHELNRSLATQVVRGHLSLDDVLERHRREAHLETHQHKSILAEAHVGGTLRVFGLHGQRVVRAAVAAIETYEVTLTPDGHDGAPAGPIGQLHKLQFKFGATTDDIAAVREVVEQDAERFGSAEPVLRPQDRYRCSDKRLFSWFDARAEIEVTTLEGDVVRAPLSWIGRWEIGLAVADSWELVVFRHAIANVSGGRWDSRKED
jgi:hypothetical protein